MNYLGPGLAVTDHLVDKHFDKIPTKLFEAGTYIPGRKRRGQRRAEEQQHQQNDSTSGSDSESELHSQNRSSNTSSGRRRDRKSGNANRGRIQEIDEENQDTRSMKSNYEDIPRYSGQGQSQAVQNYDYTPPQRAMSQQYDYIPVYSHDPPRLRQEYVPPSTSQRGRAAYQPPYDSAADGDYDDRYAQPALPSSRRRRPAAVTRRSSSYPGPQQRYSSRSPSPFPPSSRQVQRSSRRRDSSPATAYGKAKDISHRYGIKEEMSDLVTTSKTGLAGGAVGALVGGWAASKAQTAYMKKERGREGNALLTLLGAAAGGLAADVLVARYEEKKREEEEEEERKKERGGRGGGDEDDDEDDGRSQSRRGGGGDGGGGGGHRDRERRSRRRRDSE